jgi:teichuronic acid biosynthesis glycosyltransferase TuaH
LTGPDYVVYGSGAWDRPWLTEHNLANALAHRHRVLFVEPPVSPLSPVRYGLRGGPLGELRKMFLTSPLREADGLHLLRLFALPPLEHPLARRRSVALLRRQVAWAVARLGLHEPVVVAARSVVPLLGAAGERGSVYIVKDLVEAGGHLVGKDPGLLAAEQRRMCASADLVCAVTPRLQETLAERGVAAALLPHGFHAELAPAYDAPAPSDLAGLASPRIGYAGRIDGRLDFDALTAVADRHPGGSIVLLGPVSPRLERGAMDRLATRPNVHLLGSRPREELPAYLAHLDCGLLPYRDDEWLRHAAPLKLWDYLYAGPPVAGCGCAALRDFPAVHFAGEPTGLPAAVDAALAERAGGRAERRALALRNTWEDRAAELDALVSGRVHPIAA